MVHHLEIIEAPQHIHVAFGLRFLAQYRRDQQPPLRVQLHRLSKIAGALQKLSLRQIGTGDLLELVFDLRPNLHGIDPRRFARRTGDIKLVAILRQRFEKQRRHLQAALLVDFRWTVSPELHSPLPYWTGNRWSHSPYLAKPALPL